MKKDELSKESVLAAMEQLKKTPGWQIISEVLTQNVKSLEQTILDSDETWTTEKLTKFRDMRYFEKKLLELPDKIIKEASKEDLPTSEVMDKLDPYN